MSMISSEVVGDARKLLPEKKSRSDMICGSHSSGVFFAGSRRPVLVKKS